MKHLTLTLFSLLLMFWASAQGTAAQGAEQATGLRADGKIYVVVAVAVTILLGLFLYVYRLDRKISKLEKASR